MTERATCDLCGREVDVHASYVVRTEVFADPSVPPLTTEQLQPGGFDQTVDDLLQQMKGMTVEELQDGVHRHFEHRLCSACHGRFLANPLGKPRSERPGSN